MFMFVIFSIFATVAGYRRFADTTNASARATPSEVPKCTQWFDNMPFGLKTLHKTLNYNWIKRRAFKDYMAKDPCTLASNELQCCDEGCVLKGTCRSKRPLSCDTCSARVKHITNDALKVAVCGNAKVCYDCRYYAKKNTCHKKWLTCEQCTDYYEPSFSICGNFERCYAPARPNHVKGDCTLVGNRCVEDVNTLERHRI
eukprot:TRINITY_DN20937_c0_g1_i1.p1 TRINITY_DN20937_c0_g1~~TRINITY_DN20937_c0_g1_i1.p1  ORF type:complete len:200 (+),score=14.97 TRINITY_DN20937_c0_g1_i1:37-636(+)